MNSRVTMTHKTIQYVPVEKQTNKIMLAYIK